MRANKTWERTGMSPQRRVRTLAGRPLRVELLSDKPMTHDPQLLTAAHEASSNHEDVVGCSDVCGCFYCLRTFSPSQIRRS
jgi:hypothetical protein